MRSLNERFISACLQIRFERVNDSIGPRSVPKTNFRLFIKLLQVVETQKYWFAARTLSKQELEVEKRSIDVR